MYCGDGVNDLLALAASDVGMAVGNSHASAAASLCDPRHSVEGWLSIAMQLQRDVDASGRCKADVHVIVPGDKLKSVREPEA